MTQRRRRFRVATAVERMSSASAETKIADHVDTRDRRRRIEKQISIPWEMTTLQVTKPLNKICDSPA